MTHQLDVARGRGIVARWCDLAEQRLEYLTELFETGRWRRFHSELALLENIQEAKTAVETWRDLLRREASYDNTAIDMSWLGRAMVAPRGQRWRESVQCRNRCRRRFRRNSRPRFRLPRKPTRSVPSRRWPRGAIYAEATALTPGKATIAERYPLLRNAL